MCQPRKWWLGLVPLALVWLGAMAVLAPEIESELTHRIGTTIAGEMPWAKITLEGRDAYIEGTAPSAESQRLAIGRAANVPGVRLAVANPTQIAPETKPFTWSASRDGNKLTLSGFINADGTRARLLAETARIFPGLAVVDEMKDGQGAPPTQFAAMTAALTQLARLQTGSVALSDNNLAIKGAAPDQATAASIMAATRQMPSSIQVAGVDISAPVQPPPAQPAPAAAPQSRPQSATQPPVPPAAPKATGLPVESPYVFQATRRNDEMTLTGFAPTEAARAQAVSAAKSAMLGGKVVDQLKIAGGWPTNSDFATATAFAAGQLGQLSNGSAKITDGALAIEGLALDAASYRAAYAATSGQLPGGMRLERAEITPPPVENYSWKVARTAKALKFSGYFPDEDARRTMTSSLQRFPNNLALQDDTSIGSGAPQGFTAAMAMGLDQLSRLETGEARVQNGELTIDGVAPSERIANEVKDAVSKLVGGLKAQARVTFIPALANAAASQVPAAVAPAPPVATARPPAPAISGGVASTAAIAKRSAEVVAACTSDLAASVRSGQILFESSRAVVLPASRPVIERIAEAMKNCPAMRVEIAGHTDATGTPTSNDTLSKDRADAIATLLAGAGVEASRMRTAGYGSSKPVADNASPAGKAKNRRIEFNVVE